MIILEMIRLIRDPQVRRVYLPHKLPERGRQGVQIVSCRKRDHHP